MVWGNYLTSASLQADASLTILLLCDLSATDPGVGWSYSHRLCVLGVLCGLKKLLIIRAAGSLSIRALGIA
ncbi:MAG: hypothetical protein H0W43_04210 [Chthoniobacterales bacterium]|nr:hypothetical protein [Chthoniobacterales bacterium]MDQ3414182.1 hypothetical protein [Verrucomicrobiota bacterium]